MPRLCHLQRHAVGALHWNLRQLDVGHGQRRYARLVGMVARRTEFQSGRRVDYWLMADGFNHYDGDPWQGVAQGTFCIGGIGVEPLTEHTECSASRNIDALFEATSASTPDSSDLSMTRKGGIGTSLEADMLGTECWTTI